MQKYFIKIISIKVMNSVDRSVYGRAKTSVAVAVGYFE